MALLRRDNQHQTYYNDATGQYHLVNVDTDGTVTDLGAITDASTVAAIESLETQQDLTTAAVASLEVQQDLTTVSTDAISTNLLALNAIDSITGARVVISEPHNEIHEGDSYEAAFLDPDVDTAGIATLRIVAPDTAVRVHMVFGVSGTGLTDWQLFETTTQTVGTAVTGFNKDRNSVNTPTLVVTHTAGTGAADGTQIDAGAFGAAGVGNTSSGGADRGSLEWILKQNTIYLLKATSLADDNAIALTAKWYEES